MSTRTPPVFHALPSPTAELVGAVRLRPHRDERLRSGHPWVYAGELARPIPANYHGQPVVLEDGRGKALGVGLASARSNLAVRMVSRDIHPLGEDFWRGRLEAALKYRASLAQGTAAANGAARLVHGEADGLPGLVVDRYAGHLVVQVQSAGLAMRQDLLLDLLEQLHRPTGIVERSEGYVRQLEGLPVATGLRRGGLPEGPVRIVEDGSSYLVDLLEGQKTGFFLDQRLNRPLVGALAKPGWRVLNTFCYSGGFSIPAARQGAAEVLGLDISAEAVALAEANAKANGVEGICRWEAVNAFDRLRDLAKAQERFDMVILDPPAFAKSKDAMEGALRGYKEINLRAFKLVKPGGIVVSCSCSHHLRPETFLAMIAEAAADARRRVRLVGLHGAAPCHPVLPASPETDYLKTAILAVE